MILLGTRPLRGLIFCGFLKGKSEKATADEYYELIRNQKKTNTTHTKTKQKKKQRSSNILKFNQKHKPRPPTECFLEVFCYIKTKQKAWHLWGSWNKTNTSRLEAQSFCSELAELMAYTAESLVFGSLGLGFGRFLVEERPSGDRKKEVFKGFSV